MNFQRFLLRDAAPFRAARQGFGSIGMFAFFFALVAVVPLARAQTHVTSISGLTPGTMALDGGALSFQVTFSADVTGVSVSAFSLATTGTASGTVASVTPVSGAVYDVAVTSLSGTGRVQLQMTSGAAITGSPPAFTAGPSYAVASTSLPVTWGYNVDGQLGNNSTANSDLPVVVIASGALSGKTIVAMAAGADHSLALASDGTVYAWGDNTYGELGDNSTTSSSVPVAVVASGALSGKTIVAIAAGADHSLALASDGTVYAWGLNTYGQLGNNSTTESEVPVAVMASGALAGKTIVGIAAGEGHSLALASDGTLYAWGDNNSGQLGNNSTTDSSVPVAVAANGALSGKTIVAVSAGANHSLALASDGTVYAWGDNTYGELGDNSTTDSDVPTAVVTSGALSGKAIVAVVAGAYHSLALASNGTVYAWGDNTYGELGDNSTTNSDVPVAVVTSGSSLEGETVVAIAAGQYHSLALASDGTASAWGYNLDGELGNPRPTRGNLQEDPTLVDTSGESTIDPMITAFWSLGTGCFTQSSLALAEILPPTVGRISPSTGPVTGGTSVEILGTNFYGATGVSFGSTPATSFTVSAATMITAVTPAGTGVVDVTVTNPGGTSASNAGDQFTYPGPPTVTAVAPSAGPTAGGTSVTITGTNLTGATAVMFGSSAAESFTVTTATSITATSPAGSAGTVDITVTTGYGTSSSSASDQFTYAAAPSVTSLSVSGGGLGGGTTVTIAGTNFTDATQVYFGSTPAASFTVNSNDSITAVAPPGSAGSEDITVVNPGGTSPTSSNDQFTYTAAPTLIGVAPSAGPATGGTLVTVTGTNLTGASAVTFGTTAAVSFTVNSATSITAVAPAGAAGTVDITVTTLGGTSATTGNDQFAYVAAPTVIALSPSDGPTAAGTSVTITGANLTGATAVSFGTTAAASFTVNSATSITATAPASGVGTVDVTVVTAGGTSATSSADQFTYVAAPTVTGITPSAGPLAGGTSVTITGANLTGATAVTFGAGAAAAFTVNSPTSITATSPAASAGEVDITVTTAGGMSATGVSDQFTYVGSPSVTGVSVTGGGLGGGTSVTITGTNLTGTTEVFFGSTPATSFIVNGNSSITAVAPAGSAGSEDITVVTPGGVSPTGSDDRFTYYAIPAITSPLTASGTFGLPISSYFITASNSPSSFGASGLPPGLTLNSLTGQISGTPTAAAGSPYSVTLSATNPGGSGEATLQFTIAPATQTISFAPIGAATVGVPIALSASASSGLPVSFSVLSGNASVSGSTLTIDDTNPVVVEATQSGDANHASASPVVQTVTAAPAVLAAQTITFAQPANVETNSPSFNLTATASSGLPVTFTILSGPATISGSTVTLTGMPGIVTVQASQGGNNGFSAAAPVTLTFQVTSPVPLTYFGSVSGGSMGEAVAPSAVKPAAAGATSFAAYLSPDGSSGTLLGYISALNEGFVVTFIPNASGQFSATTNAVLSNGATGSALTFTGTVSSGSISGAIPTVGATFSALLDPPGGPSQPIAGLYQSALLDTAAGSTYSMVGTENDVFVLTFAPTGTAMGSGTVSNDSFTVAATGSATITGTIQPATTTVSGTVTLASGVATSYSGLAASTEPTDRLVNFSSRGYVGAGTGAGMDNLVTGFVIGGPAAKTLLLRAVGPGLSLFGVPGVLSQPQLTLFNASGVEIASNAGWNDSAALDAVFSQVGAFPFAPSSSDAALTLTLPPGTYTMQVSGVSSGTGVALAEIYDATVDPQPAYQPLINISTLGNVGVGPDVLIGGFIIAGNNSKTVLIRGVGPTLHTGFGLSGVLAAPILSVYDSGGTLLAENQGWGNPTTVLSGQVAATPSAIAAAEASTGAFALPSGSADSAVIVTLAPGSYSAQVSGAGGSTGVALVEVYEITQ